MKEQGYWSSVLESRVTRRRAIGAAGAVAAGSALLAACGGEGSGGSRGSSDKSGQITKPGDTTKQAKIGGTMKSHWDADISDYNVHFTRNAGQSIPNLAYSRFVQIKPGYLKSTTYEIAGDMAESWEWSPDGLKLTMKLRQGAGWAPLPPVNGRPVTNDDIAYTWKRWEATGSNRGDYLNSLDPDSPVLNMTTPDTKTFVFNLKFPMVGLLGIMASNIKQSYIIPVESESQYDLRSTPLGSGPFYVSQYSGSVGWTLKRSPTFYDKEHPYIGEIQRPIVPEYATQLAQFRTGATYDLPRLRAEDVLPTKRDVPQLNMYATEPSGSVRLIRFGWKPSPPEKTPFRDERVRQAYSMSIDRDAWLDVISNISGYAKEGIPLETRWATSVEPEYDGWWLDPKDTKKFGENAKYFVHNLAEAKKLLAAAGWTNGVEAISSWAPTGYGNDLGRTVEILEGMAREAGFRFVTNNTDFNTEWPKYRDGRGNVEGLAYQNWGVSGTDPGERLWKEVNAGPANLLFSGFDPDGKGNYAGDPTLETMLRNARKEQDVAKRQGIVQDAQRYMAKKLYNIRYPGQAGGLNLVWPVVKNHRVYQGGQISSGYIDYYYSWIDETEPPMKKA